MQAKYTKVRARSANEGSETGGWSVATPAPACFLMDEEGTVVLPASLDNQVRVVHRSSCSLAC